MVPADIRARFELAARYHDDTGECIYEVVRDAELDDGERVIAETDDFVVFHPFASMRPFETWIVPKAHSASFGDLPDERIEPLADVLQDTLGGLYHKLGDPDYNMVIQTAPVEDEKDDYYIWHIRILPRLTTDAGFELGSGMHINVALPEETADFMRGEGGSSGLGEG